METERVREIKQREDAEEAKRKQRVLDRSAHTTHMHTYDRRGGGREVCRADVAAW
jgi:hypothetical protein